MSKLEYKVIDDCEEDELTELGLDGWELISVSVKHWNDGRKGEEHCESFYFKREKQ